MSSETYNAWSLALQAVIWVAMVATFIVYYHQLRVMREASLGQNLLAIQSFVFEESFRQDRKTLIELGETGKAVSAWSPQERRAAERVCAAYNLVGLMMSNGVVPFELLADLRYSITTCHKAAEPLLAEVREKRSPDMWHHFTDLAERFRRSRDVFS